MKQSLNRHLNKAGSHRGRAIAWALSLAIAPLSFAQTASPALINTASYRYGDPANDTQFEGQTNQLLAEEGLIDPFGRILGCNGERLSDYTGFSMAVYDPNPADPTGTELGTLTRLTATEQPDLPGNGVAGGIAPNVQNSNPFPLSNSDGGAYNFLLDPTQGQTDPGRTYILVIRPPLNSIYSERQIKLEILNVSNSGEVPVLSYIATALDGLPLTAEGGTQLEETSALVPNAETIGLDLSSLQFSALLCPSEPAAVTKSADRATAEPGDVVIYRLNLRNQSDVALQTVRFTDTLPRGLKLIQDSVQAEIAGIPVEISTETESESIVQFQAKTSLDPQAVLNVIYAVQVTPEALRGSGQNAVMVKGQRSDNQFSVQAGPVVHQLQIRPGITSNCGVLIGRVFDDHNFDGEQQSGEPGLANAVIYLQDGNRIVTDENGLFSVANVLPGHYLGVLELASVPGYQLAPNRNRRELQSRSRWVRLAPSSLARMNFPVTPLQQPLQAEVQ